MQKLLCILWMPFVNPSVFTEKIRDPNSCLYSIVLMVFGLIGVKHYLLELFVISFIASSFPESPNSAIPMKLYVIIYCITYYIANLLIIVAEPRSSASVYERFSSFIMAVILASLMLVWTGFMVLSL